MPDVTSRPTAPGPRPRGPIPAPAGTDLDQTPPPKALRRAALLPDVPEVGSIVGPCRLIEPLGRGGTGVVFLAAHLRLGVPLAVKVVPRDVLERDPQAARGLRTEARVLARITHANVVRVWDYGETAPFPYLVLEYVAGHSLGELLRAKGRLPVLRSLRI